MDYQNIILSRLEESQKRAERSIRRPANKRDKADQKRLRAFLKVKGQPDISMSEMTGRNGWCTHVRIKIGDVAETFSLVALLRLAAR